MYKEIIRLHLKESGIDYDNEINTIVFRRDTLIDRLDENKLKKEDREMLIFLLNLLTF